MIFLAAGSAAQETLGKLLGLSSGEVRPLVSAHTNSLYYPIDESNAEHWSRPLAPTWSAHSQQHGDPAHSVAGASLVQLVPVLLRLLTSLRRLLATVSSNSTPNTASQTSITQHELRPLGAPSHLASSGGSQGNQLEPLLAELGKQLLSSILQSYSSSVTRQGAQTANVRPWWAQLGDLVGPLVRVSSQLSQVWSHQAGALRGQDSKPELDEAKTPQAVN